MNIKPPRHRFGFSLAWGWQYTKKLETWKENEGKEIKQASEEAGEGTPGEEGSEEVVVASIYIAKNVLIEDGDME